jgi:hypothetical protein
MSGVVLTARVRDPAKWEQGFRSHRELFRKNNITMMHYTITRNNDVVLYSETDDIEAYMTMVQSPAIAQAMAEDGVERDSVRIYALDKELKAS